MRRGAARRILALVAAMAATLAAWALPARASVTYAVTPVASGLDNPVAFTLTGSDKLYYGERGTGEVRSYSQARNRDKHIFTIPNVVNNLGSEQGLLGLALHPNFPTKPYIYAYATRTLPEGTRNQIVRIKLEGGVGVSFTPTFTSTSIPASNHNGGRIYMNGNRLFVIIGDAANPANSQNLSVTGGKVLRMTPNGNVPSDNPFGTLVWATGIRNSIGFDFDPQTGRLLETENGPECNDELNLIAQAANMGWGSSETCSTPPPAPQNTNQDGTNPVQPLDFFASTIAPTGMVFCATGGCGIAGQAGSYYFGDSNNGQIWRVVLNANRDDVASKTVIVDRTSSIYSMEAGADGTIYFSSSDGAIYRLSGV